MKKEETKEIVQAASKEIGAAVDINAFGTVEENVSSNDLVISKILLMQANSALVIEENTAKYADAVDSITKDVLGNMFETKLELIPFYLDKVWKVEEDKENGEFLRYEPVTSLNENLPNKDVENGVAIRRQFHRNFYCINPTKPDMPIILPLKGVSARAGKQLATLMYIQNRAACKVPPAYVIDVTGEKVKLDNKTYVAFKIAQGRESTSEEIGECLKWYSAVRSGKTKAHEVQEATVNPEF